MFENKKILVLGMARSGYAVSKFLVKKNNKVILNDSKKEEEHNIDLVKELKDLGVELIFGSNDVDIIDSTFDYVVKNPGIRDDIDIIKKAYQLNIPVINEVEVAYNFIPKDVCLIGITGTNGKTTTTTLTYNILKEKYGDRVHLAGNIGYPLISIVDRLKSNDIIVMEVSVQQSVNIKDFHPHIGLFTNLSEAHIDFLESYDNYKNTKFKMFKNQDEEDISIINIEDEELANMFDNVASNVKYFSSKKEISGAYLKDNSIYYYGEKVIDVDSVIIPGIHNIENILGSIMISKELDVDNEVIIKVIKDFKGVEHRLEFVDEVNGVKYYNDTEATNIKSTQIALKSFSNPIIIILGGMERGQDFNELEEYMQNVKAIIGIGECRNRVLEFGSKLGIDTFIYEHLKDSFNKIIEISTENDIVLLSPASASWDQYKECEIRGQEFKDLVKDIRDK